MARSVAGKTAVITGAGSGISLEFARVLLRNDCNVLLADLRLRPEAQELVERYQQKKGPRAVFHQTDATKWSDLTSAFDAAEGEFGAYDIVCPGAGVFEPPSSGFWYPPGSEKSRDAPDGNGYASIDLNLVHPIRASQLAISHFLPSANKDNPKTVVLISSIAGEMAVPMYPLYVACKWGLRGFLYSMAALEESRHIRVAGVAPAIVKTPIWLDSPDKLQLMVKDGVWDDDWTTPEEVAEAMYKICTEDEIEDARGQKIAIHGGSLIEVLANDVRDVPVFGNQPPGTGTAMKGLNPSNMMAGVNDMNALLDAGRWGKS